MKSRANRARRARRQSKGDRFGQVPRVEIVADDPSLTPFGGPAVVGELVRRLELIPALDRAIETAPKVGGLRPVKQRARGCSPGQLLVAVAESQLCGGDSMLDLERLRADAAGAELRAVAEVPAASTACQLARRYRRLHLRAAEQAFAACANGMDAQLGRRPEGPVTLDFDSTGVEVYGRNKPGAGVNYQGQLAYQPLLCSWAQRGRLLASELLAGSDSTRGEEPRQMLRRVLDYLPDGHGPVAARFDSGFYRVTCSPTAGRARCASPSRCRAQVRCGRRSNASTTTPGRRPRTSKTPRSPRRRSVARRRLCPNPTAQFRPSRQRRDRSRVTRRALHSLQTSGARSVGGAAPCRAMRKPGACPQGRRSSVLCLCRGWLPT